MTQNSIIQTNGRTYLTPQGPTAVICIDGLDPAYGDAAISRGMAPYLAKLTELGLRFTAQASMPTFINTNNASIVTGVAPDVHGIVGNYLFDAATRADVMMNDARFLRAPTLMAALQDAGVSVGFVTAKAKLLHLLSAGLDPSRTKTIAIETQSNSEGGDPINIYSAEASLAVLDAGLKLFRNSRSEFLYLSTTDYVQHAHGPDAPEALAFVAAIDQRLAALDEAGVRLMVTADHGMNAKTDVTGAPNVIYLCDVLSDLAPAPHVVLPITDPYVRHHGALGSFAQVYCDESQVSCIHDRLCSIAGIDGVLLREEAAETLELPRDRIGDLVVLGARDMVLGKRATDHDLSDLAGPLRSHGGKHEQAVPSFSNRPLGPTFSADGLRNFDAFHVALNCLRDRQSGGPDVI
jgi:phosphonoacetate hydrolase